MIVKYCKYANLSIVPCDCFVLNIYSFNKTNANVSDRVPSVITKYILVTVIFNRALISVPLKLDFKHITVINRWKTYKKLWTTLFQIMLSVQVPGCAGMERLGAPGGPRLRHDHRHHHSTLEWEKQQRLQAMVGRLQEMVEQETRARSAAAAERLGLPPSIRLPDGEYGRDLHLQLRVPYQQAELTRSSFQPPPNKCVSDVPEWAGGAEDGAASGGGVAGARRKKDGLLQKATRWWVRMGTRPALAPAPPPCVMVPRARAAPPDA